jgi:hypothetical protein
VPSIECLAGPESFSRVDNAKNTLEALCLRLRLKTENELIAIMREPSAVSQRRQELEPLVRQLEAGMQDFEGTEEELELAQDLFVAYNCTAQFERWIDLYLMISYQHPVHPVPLRLAQQALALGKQVGRLQDVLQALRHVNAIPFDFEGKDKLAAVLNRADMQRELTGLQREDQGS